MKNAENWVEAFNISPENVTAWSTEVPEGMPLLAWAIAEHKLELSDYLSWASEHFGLPVLDSTFFTNGFELKMTPDEREGGLWTPWMYPVSTWDDVILVACVEPPQEPLAGVYAYVLTDPQILKTVWLGEHAAPLDTPLGLDLNSAKKFKLDLASLGLEADGEPEADVKIEEPPKPAAQPKVVLQSSPPPVRVATPKPAAAPTPIRKVNLAELPSRVDEAIQAAFSSLKKDYRSILLLKKNGTVANALRWDSSLESTMEPSKIAVDLNFPSFLRIVSKTLQPYHGYVIDSPMHQDFFTNLNYQTSPPCVTALPVKVDGALWGLMVAIGEETALAPEVLHRATVAIEKLSETLEPSLTGTQAA